MGSLKLWEASEKSIDNINSYLDLLHNKINNEIETYIFPEKIAALPKDLLLKVFDEYFSKNEKTKHLFENKIPKTEVV